MFSSRFVRKYAPPRERGDIVPPLDDKKPRGARGVKIGYPVGNAAHSIPIFSA